MPQSENLLHLYAKSQYGLEELKELISKGEDVDTIHSIHLTTPICFAAQSGRLETVKYLIEEAKTNLDASHAEKNLFDWALYNKPGVIEYIVNPKNKIYEQFNDGTTEIHAAAAFGQLARVKALVDINPACINEQNVRRQNALYWAAVTGHFSIVNFILTHESFKQFSAPDKLESLLLGSAVRAFFQGRLLLSLKDNQGIDYYNEALECFDQLTYKQKSAYTLIYSIYDEFAIISTDEQKYEEAIEFSQMAIDSLEKSDCGPQSILDATKDLRNNINKLRNYQLAVEKRGQLSKEVEKWGFISKDVTPDGNCFFHAVIHQLSMRIREECLTPEYLREKTTEHIELHLEQYSGFIEEKTPEDYLTDMRKDRFWVDNIAIQAFSRQFNFTVVIINSDGSPPLIFRQPNPTNVLYLGYEVDYHYQSLIPPDNITAIEEMIQHADIDMFNLNLIDKNPSISIGTSVQTFFAHDKPQPISVAEAASQPQTQF